MKKHILFILLIFSGPLMAQNLVKDCSSTLMASQSFALDCELARLQVFETRNIGDKIILGRGTYTGILRFVVKNPQNFSRLVLEKPVAGAVEECTIRNLYNVGAVTLLMQSLMPHSGGTMLANRIMECLKTILAQQLLDDLIEDINLWMRHDGWVAIREVKSGE